MDIKLPIKIHNRFDIEVKDVTTGEIIQKAVAHNIVLNQFFNDTSFPFSTVSWSADIAFGSGTGTLSPSRTDLFIYQGAKPASLVELVQNQVPLTSYATKKIVIAPAEYVGVSISEVGFRRYSTQFTHALLKDSEGNALTLDPKKDTQEITIYGTVYFQPNFEPGITLAPNGYKNGVVYGMTGGGAGNIKETRFYVNDVERSADYVYGSHSALGEWSWTKLRLGTTEYNSNKIKSLSYERKMDYTSGVRLDLEVLAENNSTIWSGYGFVQTPIAVGDGVTTVFNLTWDEVWDSKPKAVYIDGVDVISGVTWSSTSITFDTAPADQSIITADYSVKYIPKDTDHVVDIQCKILYGEGIPA